MVGQCVKSTCKWQCKLKLGDKQVRRLMRCLNFIDFPYKLAIKSFVCFFLSLGCCVSYMDTRNSKRGGGEESCGYLENMARKPWLYS